MSPFLLSERSVEEKRFMISQQSGEIWKIIVQYGLPILLVFLLTWLIIEMARVKMLSSKLHHVHQQEIAWRARLQEAQEKQDALVKLLQEVQNEANRLEQTLTTLIDKVTGLPNYHAFMSRADAELSRCIRTQNSCAILFIHMDSFKRIKDTWGQEAGDAILREVSSRLVQNMRAEDFVGRYERDNFALLLVETDLAGAIQMAERLRLVIATDRYSVEETVPETMLEITASIGIASYGLHSDTGEVLLQQAISAMSRARKDGRNRVRVADIEEIETVPIMEEAYEDEQAMINALTAAASAHHEDVAKHASRITIMAEATAREIGCSEQEIHIVRLSALLHDIGKIGIPDAILDKPGPLTKEEWEIMHLHPQIGQRIMHQAGGIFAALAHVIVAHHERWDGKGYPMGLSQHDIPIEARILAVVDSFDAMTSQRVYRKSAPIEEARIELLRCAGSQFDPEVVIAFMSVLNRYEEEWAAEALPQEVTEQSSVPIVS
jgi:diguanylate cyclase (GGDEF)-like protein